MAAAASGNGRRVSMPSSQVFGPPLAICFNSVRTSRARLGGRASVLDSLGEGTRSLSQCPAAG
jgi:hypothetical protein